jgi:hypothetical protein
MKTATKVLITVLVLLLATSTLLASGQVGINAVVRKVVFPGNGDSIRLHSKIPFARSPPLRLLPIPIP